MIYNVALVMLIAGWRKASAPVTVTQPVVSSLYFTVVIPFRNEEKNIGKTLDAILNQSYRQFEIIAVDDHSTDNGAALAKQFNASQLTVVQNLGEGKKRAIATAISLAKGDVVVTTDADCSVPNNWLEVLSKKFADPSVQMVIGPVSFRQDNTFFSDLQAVEFASVAGVAGATSAFGMPTMCNGANLAYRSSAFSAVGGFDGNLHIPSGDDEFLMRKILKRHPASVRYAGTDAVVATDSLPDIKAFFSQRVRWASKWRFNDSIPTVLLAITMVIIQLAWLAIIPGLVFAPSPWLVLTAISKILLEFLFLYSVCNSLKVKWSNRAFAVLQFVYAPYVLIVAIASGFVSYEWKGRKTRYGRV